MIPINKIFGQFYSPEKALSYNRPWIISIGSRSIGKSTGWLIWALYMYLTKGIRFIYLRRTDDEVKKTADSALDSAWFILRDAGYPVFSITAEKSKFWLQKTEDSEKEEIGMYFALSQSYKFKSANFGANNYSIILYDEFINIDSTKYLGTKSNITYEYDRCLELYQTVDRGIGKPFRNETKFIFIANFATYFNPIFLGLGIDKYIRTDSKYIAPKDALWVCEQTKTVPATNEVKESYAYRLSNDKQQKYAYENIAFDENGAFIKKPEGILKALFNIKYNDATYGVYMSQTDKCIYVTAHRNELPVIALTAEGQNEVDYTLATRPSESIVMARLKQLYFNGKVYSENRKIKYILSNYFMLSPS